MPRFTEQEKEIISNKLLIEGEKLFALHGLKKVTVDDLVAAVNISKGSFYAFYPSKEHLYVEINFRLQKELFTSIETTVKKKKYKNHRDLAKDVIMLSLTGVITSPILSQIDLSLMGEVLCNGFNLTVLNPGDRRGHDAYCIVSIKGKKYGVYPYVSLSCLHHVILLKALLRCFMNLIH